MHEKSWTNLNGNMDSEDPVNQSPDHSPQIIACSIIFVIIIAFSLTLDDQKPFNKPQTDSTAKRNTPINIPTSAKPLSAFTITNTDFPMNPGPTNSTPTSTRKIGFDGTLRTAATREEAEQADMGNVHAV